ncbi:MAG: hypothetical protein Q4C85_09630 [Actinomyces sp.]|uniref:hypothetical protein n=1 Tax=Actinomyces sp. TaxID=29317 RepID=UPI0026DBF883|nr:hypothetical protein [Actinomyces sp.]MDO4243996.1 hypothetical protein [Actinomyces sp.]
MSARLVAAAGVEVDDTAAVIVVAGVAEELLKLVPLALLGSADEAAGFVRDPRGTVRGYLATHTPGEIALDAGLFVLTEVAGGALTRTAGLAARHARSELLESSLWRGEAVSAGDLVDGLGRRPACAGPDPRCPGAPAPCVRTARRSTVRGPVASRSMLPGPTRCGLERSRCRTAVAGRVGNSKEAAL